MEKATLASFRFPRRLIETSKASFAPQELIDYLKFDPSYFHQSFRRKFKPKAVEAEDGDIVTGEPRRARTLDCVSTALGTSDLLEKLVALADFHDLIVRASINRLEAIEPDFVRWHDLPGAYVLWSARILPPAADGAKPARLRVVRQLASSEQALKAVESRLGMCPQVRIDGEDMIVAYAAGKKQRPMPSELQL
jgi:hypothetical protein